MAGAIRWALGALLSVATFATTAATPAATATRLLDHLQAGDAQAAAAMFTPEMANAVPAANLLALWRTFGEPRGRGDAVVIAEGPQNLDVVVQPLHFASGTVDATVAVDRSGRVAGLHFKPAAPAPAPAVPAGATYREQPFEVVTATGTLPGTLALPSGTPPRRAVVLVHGSGPQDRDETIGPNRPFLDVARGLAAQGIAVLRYEKRSKVRPQDFAGEQYTMDEETTHDAVAAVADLAGTAGIDPRHVYVMGHSQGGMLAPRIARQSGKVAGLVLWSAPARSLLTLLPEQNRYLFGLDGQITAQEQAFLDTLDAQIAAARSERPVPRKDLPLGQPAAYWRAFEAIDPVADAQASGLPLLVLNGGRDFQVVDADWQHWKQGLDGQPRVTFQQYPALNHLGMVGQGASSLQDYTTPGKVLPALIDDVARWIREQE